MKLLRVLYIQVLIGIIAGIITGYFFPSFSNAAKLISDTFINMIRMVIPPVIFFTIVTGIAGAGNLKKAGRIGGKAIIYFEIVTTIALLIGMVIANIVKPGAGIVYSPVQNEQLTQYTAQAKDLNWGEFLTHIVPSNIIESFAKGDILQILFFSILFGIALKKLGGPGNS
ncbi:MAG TPA: cation:dicarboxylase symporter family transporter, partial [Ferruginibacter sp.]|nr:cation:dicarboxylase symporter family transporter [Ferruginibacter sp.]